MKKLILLIIIFFNFSLIAKATTYEIIDTDITTGWIKSSAYWLYNWCKIIKWDNTNNNQNKNSYYVCSSFFFDYWATWIWIYNSSWERVTSYISANTWNRTTNIINLWNWKSIIVSLSYQDYSTYYNLYYNITYFNNWIITNYYDNYYTYYNHTNLDNLKFQLSDSSICLNNSHINLSHNILNNTSSNDNTCNNNNSYTLPFNTDVYVDFDNWIELTYWYSNSALYNYTLYNNTLQEKIINIVSWFWLNFNFFIKSWNYFQLWGEWITYNLDFNNSWSITKVMSGVLSYVDNTSAYAGDFTQNANINSTTLNQINFTSGWVNYISYLSGSIIYLQDNDNIVNYTPWSGTGWTNTGTIWSWSIINFFNFSLTWWIAHINSWANDNTCIMDINNGILSYIWTPWIIEFTTNSNYKFINDWNFTIPFFDTNIWVYISDFINNILTWWLSFFFNFINLIFDLWINPIIQWFVVFSPWSDYCFINKNVKLPIRTTETSITHTQINWLTSIDWLLLMFLGLRLWFLFIKKN